MLISQNPDFFYFVESRLFLFHRIHISQFCKIHISQNPVSQSTGHSDAQTQQIRPRQKKDNFNTKPCRSCGVTFPHKDFPCPAKGKECNLCKKPNHFASVCRSAVKPKQHNSNSRRPRKTSYGKKPGPRHDGI